MESLDPLAADLERAVGKLGEVAMYMGKAAMSADVMNAFANAHPFMTVTGEVVFASATYYIEAELPISQGRMRAMGDGQPRSSGNHKMVSGEL